MHNPIFRTLATTVLALTLSAPSEFETASAQQAPEDTPNMVRIPAPPIPDCTTSLASTNAEVQSSIDELCSAARVWENFQSAVSENPSVSGNIIEIMDNVTSTEASYHALIGYDRTDFDTCVRFNSTSCDASDCSPDIMANPYEEDGSCLIDAAIIDNDNSPLIFGH